MKTHSTDKLIEYMKIHLISLNQDRDPLDKSHEDIIFIEGQIKATEHLLEVSNEL
jgi:hypothetical protein